MVVKLSRQLVLVCVECHKAWQLLQSKVGIQNTEYAAQQAVLADVDNGIISRAELFDRADALVEERMLGPAATATA